ncbi:DUF2251 domain-containing protein [Puia sp.]|jgi:hypothetical protein|uniref:DUF2251 domain-containing protein n=1 Tax=Puia sp. TaxID=2045100 RepID=UPI002F3E686E
MNGYLMQDAIWTAGEGLFIESFAPENAYGVVFEDDGDAAFFYAVEKNNDELRILDALHIHEMDEEAEPLPPAQLKIIWSRDWLKCALVIDDHVHALFDFEAHGGYNINEFPPPNDFWTKDGRLLSDDLIRKIF